MSKLSGKGDLSTSEAVRAAAGSDSDLSSKSTLAQSSVVNFPAVLDAEIDAINARRKQLGRSLVAGFPKPDLNAERDGGPPVLQTTGLALSGGGIRSAAFCLGALQALDATAASDSPETVSGDKALTALDHIDYLSTVSGGGYIGTSMVVGMTSNGGSFPFESKLDQDEPASIQHIRDHSNYLLPRGHKDTFLTAAIYLRGLAANVILVLPILLVSAAFTILLNPHLGRGEVSYWATTPFNVLASSRQSRPHSRFCRQKDQ